MTMFLSLREWKTKQNKNFDLTTLDNQVMILDKVIRMILFQMKTSQGTSFLKILFPLKMFPSLAMLAEGRGTRTCQKSTRWAARG